MGTATTLLTSNGTGDGDEAEWRVAVQVQPGLVTRDVWMDGQQWLPDGRGWCPEMTIWPAWSPRLLDGTDPTPLQGVHDYWSTSGDRLRDSAKWMAAVIGAALAVLAGTSPLAGLREHFTARTFLLGGPGILMLGVTLFLVLQ